MKATLTALSRVRQLARAVSGGAQAAERVLPALIKLLREAEAPFKIIGGLAVAHHGYVRATANVDVLLDTEGLSRIYTLSEKHGFERQSDVRLVHTASDVAVKFYVAGTPVRGPVEAVYPAPNDVQASHDDPDVISLPDLVTLKLQWGRHQDHADVVALLKQLDNAQLAAIEATIASALREVLARLRDDALAELSWECDE